MMKFYFNTKILIGCFFAFAILSWLAIYSYLSSQELITGSQWIAHTNDVLYNAEQILAISVAIELGQRGYALTGQTAFLEPYKKATSEINSQVEHLKKLTAGNKQQQERVILLNSHLHDLLQFSSQSISLREKSFEAARKWNESLRGKQLLDKIQEVIKNIRDEENTLLMRSMAARETQIQNSNYAYVRVLFVAGLVLIFTFISMNVHLKAGVNNEKRMQSEIQDLYDNAPCGYYSLDASGVFTKINKTLLQWLGYSKEEIIGRIKLSDIIADNYLEAFNEKLSLLKSQEFIHDLELQVVGKNGTPIFVTLNSSARGDKNENGTEARFTLFNITERKLAEDKVRDLNKELEAFSYSVSHDLRAPLRSIDGYTQILQEDYGNKMGEDANRVMKVVMSNAKRMGQLIDDLLDFSSLSRKEILNSNLQMDLLVRSVVNELLQKENGRKIEVEIQELDVASGDVDMIRKAWVNLISNALKYTEKTPSPKIVISSSITENEVCYAVKDNGVGFDMKYAHKLFGVFQRLHKMQDFSGTGVGLAIVQRIISKHNGRIWAEGKVNEGASFFFTIPK